MLSTTNIAHNASRAAGPLGACRWVGCALVALVLTAAGRVPAATLALGTAAGTPGGPQVTLPLVYTPGAGDLVASMQFDVSFNTTNLTITALLAGPAATSAGKSLVVNQVSPGTYRIIVAGLNQNVISGGTVAQLTFYIAPSAILVLPVSLEDVILASPSGQSVSVVTVSGSIDTGLIGRIHDTDVNASKTISLTELLRAIQFHNSGTFSCRDGTEDGFSPGTGRQDCPAYDADYKPLNWKMELAELLRLIQFYNSGGYREDPAGEDGFAPR